ncbi:aquaporin [Sphingomonas crocodyli]|nr:MIP/aquaporin family protein [Sphingomonas crocodyli]
MNLPRRIIAEFVGTAILLAIVVGSGMMGARLAGANDAIALLGNTIATGAGLIVLIWIFAPVSGAHFNPVLTLARLWRRETSTTEAAAYIGAQLAGAIFGVWIAHAMFAAPIFQIATKARDGVAQGFAECIATFGLIGTILAVERNRPDATPIAVGLYIVAAYWFTASTSFANPAVTIARSLSDSFAGIAPHSVPMFIAGQAAGAIAAILFFPWLLHKEVAA